MRARRRVMVRVSVRARVRGTSARHLREGAVEVVEADALAMHAAGRHRRGGAK